MNKNAELSRTHTKQLKPAEKELMLLARCCFPCRTMSWSCLWYTGEIVYIVRWRCRWFSRKLAVRCTLTPHPQFRNWPSQTLSNSRESRTQNLRAMRCDAGAVQRWWRCEWEWECFRCSMPFRCLTSLVILSLSTAIWRSERYTGEAKKCVSHRVTATTQSSACERTRKDRKKDTERQRQQQSSSFHDPIVCWLYVLSRVSMLSLVYALWQRWRLQLNRKTQQRQQHRQFHFNPPERQQRQTE